MYPLCDNKDYQAELDAVLPEAAVRKLDGAHIAITGATGLLGSYVCDLVSHANGFGAKISVTAISRSEARLKERFGKFCAAPGFTLVRADVNEPFSLPAGVTHLVFCASNTHASAYASDPFGTIATSSVGICNALRACGSGEFVRGVYTSSAEVYATASLFTPVDGRMFREGDAKPVSHPYVMGKLAGESLFQAYCSAAGYGWDILRLSRRIYGPSLIEDSKAIAGFLQDAASGRDILLSGQGRQTWSSLYVADAAAGVIHFLAGTGDCDVYNISDPSSAVPLRRYAEIIAEAGGGRAGFSDGMSASPAPEIVLDNAKAVAAGWKPIFSLREGLAAAVRNIQNMGCRMGNNA